MSKPDDYALSVVRAERERQKELWGDATNEPYEWMSILGEEFGELCQAVNETYFLTSKHPERGGREAIVKEAAQVAAVALAIIEDFSGRKTPDVAPDEDDGVLLAVLRDYFDIDNGSYTFELTRDKGAFGVGTMTMDDFEEWTEENVADLHDYIVEHIGVTDIRR